MSAATRAGLPLADLDRQQRRAGGGGRGHEPADDVEPVGARRTARPGGSWRVISGASVARSASAT